VPACNQLNLEKTCKTDQNSRTKATIKKGALMAIFHANSAIKRRVTTAGLYQKRMA
jgi:hypothetical protein